MKPMPLPTPLDASPEQVREALAPLRNDFSIALMSPGNAFAAGAIIRVAHSYLAREIFVVGGGQWYEKASMGMHKYETIHRVTGPEELRRATAGRPSIQELALFTQYIFATVAGIEVVLTIGLVPALLAGAIAQERGQAGTAKQHYKKYLELEPNGEHAAETRKLLTRLGG